MMNNLAKCASELYNGFLKHIGSGSVFFHLYPNNSGNSKNPHEELLKNPFYDKYSHKIEHLQKTSPEEYLSRLDVKNQIKTETSKSREYSHVGQPKTSLEHVNALSHTKPKSLKDVMKTELLDGKTVNEVKLIWEEYHQNQNMIAAVIPSENYELIYQLGKKYPIFIFPLPRERGYEFILLQVAEHEVHFTPLINYQAHKENAPECFTMVHYVDIQEKGIVLMRGEYDKNILDSKEALCLANQFQLYYGCSEEKKLRLLERFTHAPNDFRHMDLIAELECLTV